MSCKSYTKIFVIRLLSFSQSCVLCSQFKAIKGNLGWPSLGEYFASGKIGS